MRIFITNIVARILGSACKPSSHKTSTRMLLLNPPTRRNREESEKREPNKIRDKSSPRSVYLPRRKLSSPPNQSAQFIGRFVTKSTPVVTEGDCRASSILTPLKSRPKCSGWYALALYKPGRVIRATRSGTIQSRIRETSLFESHAQSRKMSHSAQINI